MVWENYFCLGPLLGNYCSTHFSLFFIPVEFVLLLFQYICCVFKGVPAVTHLSRWAHAENRLHFASCLHMCLAHSKRSINTHYWPVGVAKSMAKLEFGTVDQHLHFLWKKMISMFFLKWGRVCKEPGHLQEGARLHQLSGNINHTKMRYSYISSQNTNVSVRLIIAELPRKHCQ